MSRATQSITIGLLVVSISGCAYQPPKDVNSTFYAPPTGSTLRLQSPISIAPNEGKVLIQDGKIVTSYWGVDAYYPNCTFELRNNAEVERIVEPDNFIITRVSRDTEDVMLHLPAIVADSGSGGGGPPNTESITIMDLKSEKQPEVMRMSCQQWDNPNEATHLSIEQIRKTLDPLFTLDLPDS